MSSSKNKKVKPRKLIGYKLLLLLPIFSILLVLNYIYNPQISGTQILNSYTQKYQKEEVIYYKKYNFPYNINGGNPNEYGENWFDSELTQMKNIATSNNKIFEDDGYNLDTNWEINYKKKLYKRINVIYGTASDRNIRPYKDTTFEDLKKTPIKVSRAWLHGKIAYKLSAYNGYYILYFDPNSFQQLREVAYNKISKGKQLSFIKDIQAEELLPRTPENLAKFFTPPAVPKGFKFCQTDMNRNNPNWYTNDNCEAPVTQDVIPF